MFVIQLLGSMKILVKYPVMVRVDNLGTIFMCQGHFNKWEGCLTYKHLWYY